MANPTPHTHAGLIIWVSPTGDDLVGNGLQRHPYKTIERALQDFTEGKQIRLLDGTYNPIGTIAIDGISGSIFAENPNDATIQPTRATVDNASVSIKNTERFSITGVNILQPMDPTANYVGLYVNNVNNFLAYSCDVYTFDFSIDHIGYGIFASGGGRIEHCSAYNIIGGEIYGIKTVGISVIECDVTALSGSSVVGIEPLDTYVIT